MITRMTRYTLLCLGSDSDAMISSLQENGLVDIVRSSKPVDEQSSALLAQAATIREKMSGQAEKTAVAALEKRMSSLDREKTEGELWGAFSSGTLQELSDAGYGLEFHVVPSKSFREEWALEVIARENGKTYFVCPAREDGSSAGNIPGLIPQPRDAKAIAEDIAIVGSQLAAARQKVLALPDSRRTLLHELNGVLVRLDAYLASRSTAADTPVSDYVDCYEAYAPSSDDATVKAALDRLDVYYVAEPASGDSTPVKLRNNWFARQGEVFTGMYGMPVYGEFDPTPILTPFYLLFFSMCMGDAGYGILLMAASLFLQKKMPQSSLGKLHSLILLLGAATFAVGILFGTFFGISLFEAAWVPAWLKKCMLVEGNIGAIAGFDPQMIIALGVGVFHICLAMVVKTACYTVRKGFLNCLSTWGWTLLIVGGVIVAALFVAGLLGGQALKWTVIVLGALSALGIFIFNKPGRNPLINVGAGLWDSYNVASGLLGDVLSYIRLYALGLAGGMLGGAFNDIALMVLGQNPSWQWLPFALIVLVGHALNVALSSLGAFVHPLRLTFVEYFKNSGFEGTGRPYRPLSKEINN